MLAAREGELSQEARSLSMKEARLKKKEKEAASRKALLDAQEQALAAAEERKIAELACFPHVELRLRTALRSLCRDESDEPLATPEDGFATLAKGLVTALEIAFVKVDKILDIKCRDLFFVATTRVFSHLHLRYPRFDLSFMIVRRR
ncbi:hypothetical protein D1007_30584 [Hordeum vulgare]|nr:hypothetical protein D1007_30584 [Hordeum vulgare]